MNRVPLPGLAAQEKYRNTFRVAGVLVVGVGFVLTAIALMDFFATFADPSRGMPTKFFLGFIGLPLMGFGGALLRAGFMGMALQYAAGESLPVVKDGAAYLTDGEGLLGVGRTVDDEPATGPFCRSCGVRNDTDARYCDGCGLSLA